MDQYTEQLERQLSLLKFVITQLCCLSPKPIEVLEKRLCDFIALIVDIPDEYRALQDRYNDMFAKLWTIYCGSNDEAKWTATNSTPTQPSPVLANEESSQSAIEHELCNLFSEISLPSSDWPAEVGYLKKLVEMSVRARELLKPFGFMTSRSPFNAEAFEHAYSRLPTKMQLKFDNEKCDRSLYRLIGFILAEIRTYLFELNQKSENIQIRFDYNSKNCRYCLAEDHQMQRCPVIRDMLCYKCLQTGHKARNCKGPQKNRFEQNKRCYSCSQIGHIRRNCSTNNAF